jgi:hypothetical protein
MSERGGPGPGTANHIPLPPAGAAWCWSLLITVKTTLTPVQTMRCAMLAPSAEPRCRRRRAGACEKCWEMLGATARLRAVACDE